MKFFKLPNITLSCTVEKKICFIQISLGNRALYFRDVFLAHRYTTYADDITFFVKSQTSLIEISKGINKFSKHSGLKPNKSKCQKLQE